MAKVQMEEISEFFLAGFPRARLYLGPVIDCGQCAVTQCGEPNAEAYVDGALRARKLGQKLGREVKTTAAAEVFPKCKQAYCGAIVPNFGITVDNIISACNEVLTPTDERSQIFHYGHYDPEQNKFIFDEDRIRHLRGHVVSRIAECSTCFCKWQCAGDCWARDAIGLQGKDVETDFRCQVNRAMVKQLLLETLNRHRKTPCADK